MLIRQIIESVSILSEKIKNGKYVMQDDILYRMMNINELISILDNKQFTSNPSISHLKMRERRDSTLYDLSAEREQLKDVEHKDVQLKRKSKLPKGMSRGFFKSFSRGINDFLSLNFNNKQDVVIVSFYRNAIKELPDSKLVPFGWLKNFYDNYDISDDNNYIATKHELEDRLYFKKSSLPLTKNLNHYIKAVYINTNNISEKYKENIKKLIKTLRKENIDVRYINENIDTKNLTHLELQKSISHKEINALRPDDNSSQRKTSKLNAIKDITDSNPLEYYTYNKIKINK